MRYTVKTIKLKLKACEAELPTISDPQKVVALAKEIYSDLDADQEHFAVLALNKANTVTGFKVIHSGGIDESVVCLPLIFRYALLLGATSIIAVHNHPSNRTEPSREDIAVTIKIKSAGEMLGIKLLDHIILAGENYLSFREKGLIN